MRTSTRRESSEVPRLVLAIGILSVVGFSLVLFAQLLWLEPAARADYALGNVLGRPGRNRLLLSLVSGGLLPAFGGVWLRFRKRAGGAEELQRLATLLAPLALLFIVPGLFLSQLAENKPLFYLVTLSAFGLALRALLAASLSVCAELEPPRVWQRLRARLELRIPGFLALLAVCVPAAGFALVLGRNAVAHHRLIQTIDTDVGIADNVMANLSLGHWFRAPAQFGTLPGNYLTVHAEFASLLFVPIYRWRPGSETLLWLQVSATALSVVPLFLLAQRLLGQRMAVWACLAFLSLAPLHGALLYTFSWLPVLCLFSFTLYYAIVAEHRVLLWVMLPLVLATSEAAPLGVFALGWVVAASLGRIRLGLLLCLLSALVFALDTWIALHAPGGHTPPVFAQALVDLFSNPVYFALDLARATKIAAILHVLAPLALLPLTSLAVLPLLFPGLLLTSASSEFWPAAHAAYASTVIWVPLCMLSVLVSLQRLQKDKKQRPLYLASVVVLTLTLLSHSFDFGALLRPEGFGGASVPAQFQTTPLTLKRYADLKRVTGRIPPTASVVATLYMVSQVSSRADVFDARRPYGAPDCVFFSSLELVGDVREALSNTLSGHGYSLVANAGEFYLFRRGAETAETTAALRNLGLLQEPSSAPRPASPAVSDAPAAPEPAKPAHHSHKGPRRQ